MPEDRIVRVLKLGLEKIKEGWCINYLAKDKDDTPVSATSPKAVKWCVEGAMEFAGFKLREHMAANEAIKLCGRCVPEDFHAPDPYQDEDPIYRAIKYNNAQEDAGPVEELIQKAIAKREGELVPA